MSEAFFESNFVYKTRPSHTSWCFCNLPITVGLVFPLKELFKSQKSSFARVVTLFFSILCSRYKDYLPPRLARLDPRMFSKVSTVLLYWIAIFFFILQSGRIRRTLNNPSNGLPRSWVMRQTEGWDEPKNDSRVEDDGLYFPFPSPPLMLFLTLLLFFICVREKILCSTGYHFLLSALN